MSEEKLTDVEEKNVEESNVEAIEASNEETAKSEEDLKDERIAKQSEELTYLTSTIIPNLKKEVKELRAVKINLTDALEKSTKKYYEQLDINAVLSDNLTKVSAEHAVNKVRLDKLDSTIENIKKEANDKTEFYKSKLAEFDVQEINSLKDNNEVLSKSVAEKDSKIKQLEEKSSKLQSEVLDLRKKLIELGNYKDEVNAESTKTVNKYKDIINNLNHELNTKQSNYDRLYDESQKTINDLKIQINRYKKAINEHSNRGLFDRLSNKPIRFDD
ncbi:MAG: acyltransferase [Methanobrevibacter sp.]|uniref:acyltransferase n=1 Tax=Methanobrevibacter sp. TaxID=66852 RepID=UPI0026DF3BBF|nr:acyltransferase [Methanobrevibacter sp.]MDO5848591.1 acyltransferase [Methanobrevibacter sp.]